MVWAVIWLVVGGAALWIGGDHFVRGAARIAERTGLPTLLVGLVVAGFGTSTPELAVSLFAQARGDDAIALGNAVGSNVANVFFVLGLAGLIAVVSVSVAIVRREIIAVGIATAAVIVVALDGVVGRLEGALLFALFVVVLAWLAVSAMRAAKAGEEVPIDSELTGGGSTAAEVLRTVAGLAAVLVGADRVVFGARELALSVGISEEAIGLTLVAFGTSLPEVVTSVVAARRGEPELVVGNVLGSNIFNALLIVGAAGLWAPLTFPMPARGIALVAVALTAVAVLLFLRPNFRLGRVHGAVGLAAYGVFVALLAAAG